MSSSRIRKSSPMAPMSPGPLVDELLAPAVEGPCVLPRLPLPLGPFLDQCRRRLSRLTMCCPLRRLFLRVGELGAVPLALVTLLLLEEMELTRAATESIALEIMPGVCPLGCWLSWWWRSISPHEITRRKVVIW